MIIIKIGFIGAGKVGFSLGKYLRVNNISVMGYYSKRKESSLEVSKFTNTKQFLKMEDLIYECDIIFITTGDKDIITVWNNLKKFNLKNKIICHCSGSLSSDIFSDINSYGSYGYSIHPLFPINNKFNSYKNLKEAFITIEGDKKYLDYFYSLFKSFGNEVKIITRENKMLYHSAAVFSSNLVTALISSSINYLKVCGFNNEEAINSLYPLIIKNINNIKEVGVLDSVTGPIERGDLETIKRHLDVIPKEDTDMYKLLSTRILEISKSKNKNRDYKEMERFLNE